MSRQPAPRIALILAGGGARGAYEAGVIRYLRTEVARTLGTQPRFDLICGTSVGAINACYLAATAHDPERQADDLAALWGELSIEDVFRLPASHLLQLPRWILGGLDGRMSLLRAEPLERLVTHRTPWARIRRNLAEGHLEALTVSATRISDEMVTLFTQCRPGTRVALDDHPFLEVRPVRIGPRHALASAAIPIVFPAVSLANRLYCDGGLRQNTPLLPALALGADKVLVVSLRHHPTPGPALASTPPADNPDPAPDDAPGEEDGEQRYPSAPFLFGKVLNALLLDQVEQDLARLKHLNAAIDDARARFGDAFVDQLAELRSPWFGTAFRRIEEVNLSPSQDIGALAAEHLEPAAASASGLAGRLLRRLAGSGLGDEDLSSYLLFHGPYARDLINLAYADCRRQHDRLVSFFGG